MKPTLKPVTINKAPAAPDYARYSLAEMIAAHATAVQRHDAAADDTPDAEAAYNQFMALEVAVGEYPAKNHRELAIKARFVFEFCQMGNYTGISTCNEEGLDHTQAASFLTVRDIERLATEDKARATLYALEGPLNDLTRLARLANRLESSGDVTAEERDEIGMLLGMLQDKSGEVLAMLNNTAFSK